MNIIVSMWPLFAVLGVGVVALVGLKVLMQRRGGRGAAAGEVEYPFEKKELLSA